MESSRQVFSTTISDVLNLCQVVNFFTQPVFKLLFMHEVNTTK